MEARIRRHYDAIASGKSRRASQQSVSSSNDGSTELAERPLFPFPSSYPAHLAIHNTLILASFFLSPRFIALEPLPEQLRNLDRPQHPFLAPLTARPDLTALWFALGNALLIPWFAGSVREWFREGKMGLGMKERVQDENKSADIWNATAFTGYATIAYSLLIVLFGAPVVTHVTHTLLLALNLALMTIFIPAYAFGVPQLPMGLPFISPIRQGRSSGSALALNDIYVRLFAEYKLRTPLERAVVYPVICALLGAWAGVIPIGLDWDRPWQAYPLTPLFGATVGYVIGSVGALIVSVTYFFAAHDVSQSTARDTTAKKISESKKGKKAKNI